jgi:hypothetical protein
MAAVWLAGIEEAGVKELRKPFRNYIRDHRANRHPMNPISSAEIRRSPTEVISFMARFDGI